MDEWDNSNVRFRPLGRCGPRKQLSVSLETQLEAGLGEGKDASSTGRAFQGDPLPRPGCRDGDGAGAKTGLAAGPVLALPRLWPGLGVSSGHLPAPGEQVEPAGEDRDGAPSAPGHNRRKRQVGNASPMPHRVGVGWHLANYHLLANGSHSRPPSVCRARGRAGLICSNSPGPCLELLEVNDTTG